MGVEEYKVLESRGGQARAKIADYGHESGGGDRERSGKPNMLVALPVADWRQGIDKSLAEEQQLKSCNKHVVVEQMCRW